MPLLEGRRGIIANVACFVVACAGALLLSLRELSAWIELRRDGAEVAPLRGALESDADLLIERATRRLEASDRDAAREDLEAALRVRPRDARALLLVTETIESPIERLRFTRLAASRAPYRTASAETAFAIAFAAVEARAPRAAFAREQASRLRASSVETGVQESLNEAFRLDDEMRRILDVALETYAATSPTARGMRFLEDSLTRAKSLRAELDTP